MIKFIVWVGVECYGARDIANGIPYTRECLKFIKIKIYELGVVRMKGSQ